jgi:predicted alpha/beta superfamily hydrolase
MKKLITILVLALLSFTSYAQEKGIPNVVGISHTINSNVLKEDRKIQVYLPKDYVSSNKTYPVIYLLDGQRFFLYGASLYQTFSEFNLSPDFITVGITNVQAKRMNTFSARAKDFGEFLQNEVISLIDANYRTSNKRLLFGWAYGGGFGLETVMSKPNLFDGYILSSPFPISSKMERFKEFIKKHNSLSTFIYFVSDAKEFGVKEGTEELNTFLSNNQTNLRWKFKVLSGEEHLSTVYPALFHGLQEYFENYTEISFSDLEEFNTKGGLNYVNQYYEKRFKLYGLSKELAPFTKFAIIRLAIQAKNYNQFHNLVTNFKQETLISELKLSRLFSIADFYTENKKTKEALAFYKLLSEKYPTSERLQKKLKTLK